MVQGQPLQRSALRSRIIHRLSVLGLTALFMSLCLVSYRLVKSKSDSGEGVCDSLTCCTISINMFRFIMTMLYLFFNCIHN